MQPRQPTTRLRIEPMHPNDTMALFAMHADPRLYDYIPGVPFTDPAAFGVQVTRLSAGAPADSPEVWFNWTARLRTAPEQAVGALQATCTGTKAWIGYTMAPEIWGQGLGGEALDWLIDALHGEHGIEEIWASVDVRNAASLRLLARRGFHQTETVAAELRGLPTVDAIFCHRRTP